VVGERGRECGWDTAALGAPSPERLWEAGSEVAENGQRHVVDGRRVADAEGAPLRGVDLVVPCEVHLLERLLYNSVQLLVSEVELGVFAHHFEQEILHLLLADEARAVLVVDGKGNLRRWHGGSAMRRSAVTFSRKGEHMLRQKREEEGEGGEKPVQVSEVLKKSGLAGKQNRP